MGFFDIFKSKTESATDSVKEVASDAIDTVSDAVSNVDDDAVEVAEEKKDGCCGGNCGS